MNFIPIVVEQSDHGERSFDIYSKLLQERIILLIGEIDEAKSSLIISQLLFLDKQSNDDIYIYISSPGGSITAGMAIYDTIHYISAKVTTICVGMAMSMGAFLLASATSKRYALKHAEIMIHQPLGGMQGQVTDIDIQTKRLLRIKDQMCDLLSYHTKQPIEKIRFDTERDYYMSSYEAKEYGIIDEVIENNKDL